MGLLIAISRVLWVAWNVENLRQLKVNYILNGLVGRVVDTSF